MIQDDQCERALELIKDYTNKTAPAEKGAKQEYSFFDKIRMAIEVLLFGWVMPGKKSKHHSD